MQVRTIRGKFTTIVKKFTIRGTEFTEASLYWKKGGGEGFFYPHCIIMRRWRTNTHTHTHIETNQASLPLPQSSSLLASIKGRMIISFTKKGGGRGGGGGGEKTESQLSERARG